MCTPRSRAVVGVSKLTRARFNTCSSLIAILIACLLATSPEVHAQSGFASSMGGIGSDEGIAIAVDTSGNVYTTGSFDGTADFDPGASVFDLTSAGGLDIFISKLDSSGNFLLAKAMGGAGTDRGLAIAVDSSGNVYTTGSFDGTVDFNPGASAFDLTSTGGLDLFVSKLDASGNFLWAKAIGGAGDDQAFDLALDDSGNVHTTGSFDGTVDFDPGASAFDLTSAGGLDLFVSKLDPSGNFLWAKAMGGTGVDQASGIAVDASGNVHTVGTFQGMADFDPGASVFNLSIVNGNLFVSKFDASGNFLWATAMGGTGNDQVLDVAVDASGNVHTTGYFQDTADFDPGPGIFNVGTMGGLDVFISKLDVSGNFLWVKSLGGADSDRGSGIAVDDMGNVYTTGSFEGTADFDPRLSVLNLTSAGLVDIFVSKLDASGDPVWTRTMGSAGSDQALGIALDSSGNAYTTGSFEGVVDFDPGTALLNLTSAGLIDIFVSKLSSAGSLPLLGDANQDGLVNSTDTLWMIQFEFGLRTGLTNETSDLNGDTFINSTDALWAVQIEFGSRPQP